MTRRDQIIDIVCQVFLAIVLGGGIALALRYLLEAGCG
jgi:hypothetical protein